MEVAFPDLSITGGKRSEVYKFRSDGSSSERPSVDVLGAQNMNNIVGRSAGWGAIFGAAAAFASGLCLAIFWSTARTGHAGDFTTLMILWVPPVAIMGGGAAAVLFGVVAVIVNFSPGRIEASPISYAVLGSLLSLGIIILPFASWVAGGLHRALQGAQGASVSTAQAKSRLSGAKLKSRTHARNDTSDPTETSVAHRANCSNCSIPYHYLFSVARAGTDSR